MSWVRFPSPAPSTPTNLKGCAPHERSTPTILDAVGVATVTLSIFEGPAGLGRRSVRAAADRTACMTGSTPSFSVGDLVNGRRRPLSGRRAAFRAHHRTSWRDAHTASRWIRLVDPTPMSRWAANRLPAQARRRMGMSPCRSIRSVLSEDAARSGFRLRPHRGYVRRNALRERNRRKAWKRLPQSKSRSTH